MMATETDIANKALGKIKGAGDQESGTGLIASINGSDRVSVRCKLLLPDVRRRVIGDLATLRAPFKETLTYRDLGAENSSPPELGGWDYAFNLPGDCITVMRQIAEDFVTVESSITDVQPTEYRFDVLYDGVTKILVTNNLTNENGDSAFIQYVFDQKNTGAWNDQFIDAVATLLGAELVPVVGAVDEERIRLLTEYETVNIPKCMAHNRGQSNIFTRTKANLKGGRSELLPGV